MSENVDTTARRKRELLELLARAVRLTLEHLQAPNAHRFPLYCDSAGEWWLRLETTAMRAGIARTKARARVERWLLEDARLRVADHRGSPLGEIELYQVCDEAPRLGRWPDLTAENLNHIKRATMAAVEKQKRAPKTAAAEDARDALREECARVLRGEPSAFRVCTSGYVRLVTHVAAARAGHTAKRVGHGVRSLGLWGPRRFGAEESLIGRVLDGAALAQWTRDEALDAPALARAIAALPRIVRPRPSDDPVVARRARIHREMYTAWVADLERRGTDPELAAQYRRWLAIEDPTEFLQETGIGLPMGRFAAGLARRRLVPAVSEDLAELRARDA